MDHEIVFKDYDYLDEKELAELDILYKKLKGKGVEFANSYLKNNFNLDKTLKESSYQFKEWSKIAKSNHNLKNYIEALENPASIIKSQQTKQDMDDDLMMQRELRKEATAKLRALFRSITPEKIKELSTEKTLDACIKFAALYSKISGFDQQTIAVDLPMAQDPENQAIIKAIKSN